MQQSFITPECKAKYIWLFRPNETYEPVYSVTCIVDDTADWKALFKHITDEHNAYFEAQRRLKKNLKKSPHMPWKTTDDGEIIFTAKNKAVGVKKDGSKFDTKPKVYGPDLKLLQESELSGSLGAGTILRVGYKINLWTTEQVGVSARLGIVQIIEPKYYNPFEGFADVNGDGLKKYEKNTSLFRLSDPVKKSAGIEIDNILKPSSLEDEVY